MTNEQIREIYQKMVPELEEEIEVKIKNNASEVRIAYLRGKLTIARLIVDDINTTYTEIK